MRRTRLFSIFTVLAVVAALQVLAGPAAAEGDPFVGRWENTERGATWVVTPVSDGVYTIEESVLGACTSGPAKSVDTAAIAVDDVLLVNWVTTECLGGPIVLGTVWAGRTITLLSDGTAVHERPGGATYSMTRTSIGFFDVGTGLYYTDAVVWLGCEKITTGTTATTFSPGDPVTRAQMAAFLWREAGSPAPASLDTPFVDVPAGLYYSTAVAWLVEEAITTGTTPTTFSPGDPVTRAQMAAFLWRGAGSPGPASLQTPFVDVAAGLYYSTAVAWLVEEAITTGTTPTTFSPGDRVTRAQMAAFLWRRAGQLDCDGLPSPGLPVGFQGFVLTKATADEYGITHMDQINDVPELRDLFDSNDDGTAEIYGCQLDWRCDNIIDSMIAFSGWTNIEQTIGDYDATFAAALADVEADRPMVLYVWSPSPYVDVGRIVPGHNVVILSVDDVLDDSNPLGDPDGEEYDQRPGIVDIDAYRCPGAVAGKCQSGWNLFEP